MKKTYKAIALIALLGLALYECTTKKHAQSVTLLPQNVYASCSLSADTFKTWFVGGQVTQGGLVTPANSVGLVHNVNCQFYQWAERMFLWVTSPDAGKIVLQSSGFYSVSPSDSLTRPMIQNSGAVLKMTTHISKLGPDRLPVIRDSKGGLYEMETTGPGEKAAVKDSHGKLFAVAQVKVVDNKTILFTDATGHVIEHPQPVIFHQKTHMKIVHRYAAGNKFVFLDSAGNPVQSDEGQATGDMLMSSNGSLVYYLTMVNDVYAWYRTMIKQSGYPMNFPTTPGDLKIIQAYAKLQGDTALINPNTLAMEFKSSWVEASTLTDTSTYIMMTATIPTYSKANPAEWIPNGEKTVRMALVGIHVVGSVAGHPEMVWSTFEHNNNTPNATYQYLDTAKNVITMPQDTGNHWLFSSNASDPNFNVTHIKAYDTTKKFHISDTAYAAFGQTISPSNTLRTMPWGSAYGAATNGQDKSSAASNSEIISLNNSIQSMLVGNDLRKNYILIGATWTENGAAPNGNVYGSDTTAGVSIGTSVLANSTMETYIQGSGTSCFTCHSNSSAPTLAPKDISHIFGSMAPLHTRPFSKKH